MYVRICNTPVALPAVSGSRSYTAACRDAKSLRKRSLAKKDIQASNIIYTAWTQDPPSSKKYMYIQSLLLVLAL